MKLACLSVLTTNLLKIVQVKYELGDNFISGLNCFHHIEHMRIVIISFYIYGVKLGLEENSDS